MADIIVVDDETDVAFMIADYLQAKGYRIRTASGGAELREAIAAAKADLVVLDLNMPGENGFSLARWLREHHDTGILMLTGADSVFDKVAGLEVGADDYLAKPFSPVELEARIAAVLRRRRPKGSDNADALPRRAFRLRNLYVRRPREKPHRRRRRGHSADADGA
ncbi:response regulator transcription factor [Mesorhizobium sp.]|uniref:response regulator transcription factor n=1 Tax=Mesorhizobium sp. TaxID=1871066 RepID=UPI0025ECF06A|nr:response regulator transcription factor [Mesorhizobium sp.]